MSLLVKAQREGQTIARVTPETAAWRYVGFAAYRMGTDEVVHVFEPAREVCIVVLAGAVDVETADHKWSSLGSRDSVFEDAAPYAVYLPPGVRTTVRALRDAEVGVASAPAKGGFPARLIEPSQMNRSTRGKGLNRGTYAISCRRLRLRSLYWLLRFARRVDMLRVIRRISMTLIMCRSRVRSKRLIIIGLTRRRGLLFSGFIQIHGTSTSLWLLRIMMLLWCRVGIILLLFPMGMIRTT
jgi:hypothetical protein